MRIRHSLAIAILLVAPALAEVPAVVVQEGVLFDNRGAPLGGPVDLVFRLFDEPQGGQRIWQESHREVELVAGYYSVVLGADEALTPAVLDRATHFEVVADGGVLSPRIQLGSVPFALVARDVQGGTVDVTTIRIDGEEVINASGEWVGDPVGLRGAQGVAGVAGPQGPAGPAGAAGGQGEAGSPDTPAQVRDKLLQADGAGSGVDADLLDGIDSAAFVRVGAAIDATTFRGQAPAAFARTPQDVLGRLRQVDGAGSGVDADRLDGIDSSQFVRGAAQILGLLRGVDGSGSGLDADRLDGLDSGQFMRADTNTGTSGNLVVRGALSADSLKLAESDAACNDGNAGAIRWSGEVFEGCDGSDWVILGGKGAAEGSGFAFDCVPGGWSYTGNRVICERRIELPHEMAIVTHINGHWGRDSGWCMAEITFDDERPYFSGNAGPYRAKDAIHAYDARWRAVSMVRTKILPAGSHTVRYSVNQGGGTCWLNGSSLHGVAVPTYGEGQEFSCVPGAWSYRGNSMICSRTIDLPVRSVVTTHFNGHWRVSNGWCMTEILYDGEEPYWTGNANGPYRNKDALHGYNTGWRAVSSSRTKILDRGRHTVRYAITASSAACWINGSSLRGVAFPAKAGAREINCTPGNWSYRNGEPCGLAVDIGEGGALVAAHVNGHWSTNGWCMNEILFDGDQRYGHASSPYRAKDALHGYPSDPWQPIGTMRTKALSPGRHTIRYSVSESSYCAINGTSMHGFIVPK